MQSAVATTTTATQLARSAAKTATPLKPILKSTSSLLGKRKGLEDDNLPSEGSSTDSPQSPRKRQRVEFDMNLEIHEVGARTVEEIKKEIWKALEGHAHGDDEDYDVLKETVAGRQRLFDVDDNDDEELDKTLPERRRQELKGYMVALTGFVPRLGRSASGLVKSVLRCQWLGRDDQFATVYTQFLGALVSAQGSYLNLVLEMLVDKFSNSRPADWAVPDFPAVTRERMQDRLHQAVRYLLRVFPAANVVLGQVIVSKFPYHDESSRVHLAYVDNLLRLRKYASQLQTDITDLITNRLVHIDVKMQMDMDDLDDRLTAMVLMALRSAQASGELPADDDDESDAESVDSDDEEDEFNQIKSVKESIEKLDVTLDRLFKLYTPYFEDPDSTEALINQSETLLDLFCGTLINTAFESNRPLVLRQAASAYLASFVARGAMVPDKMRSTYEVNCRGPDVRRYAPFYSLMQALMYIFCFRWKDLIQEVPEDVDEDELSSYLDQDITWIPDVKEVLRRNIYSKLNPLKVCSPAIVEQFAPLAHRLRFMYVYPLIEANKRLRLSQFVSTAYANGGALRESGLDLNDESWQQLDSYFPFDPYQLPTSKHWVEGDYLPWRNIPGLNPDEEDSDEEEVVEEDIDEDTATDDEDERDD
ncbi:RNA polymerase I specific transcription initiation factor RRN3 [Apiospora phragmitis]|uniref:RNA polymerase I specific transcription initiation factor RRN3 n=1 Tax=Apiospora phragmitis TaxID=2905665 RepID=A0ABR1TQD6_9PEZI